MRRHMLHIAVALFTFTAGFLFVATYDRLAFALLSALFAFTLFKTIPALNIDLHYLKVGAITLLIWGALAYFLLPTFLPQPGSCVAFATDEYEPAIETTDTITPSDRPADNAQTRFNEFDGITVYSCEGARHTASTFDTIWAGVIDRKAIAKPAPVYPPTAKSATIKGTVAVSVIVDEAGKVLRAHTLSGHPVLRQSALEAACRARFRPSLVNGPPVRMNGVLTYSFDPK